MTGPGAQALRAFLDLVTMPTLRTTGARWSWTSRGGLSLSGWPGYPGPIPKRSWTRRGLSPPKFCQSFKGKSGASIPAVLASRRPACNHNQHTAGGEIGCSHPSSADWGGHEEYFSFSEVLNWRRIRGGAWRARGRAPYGCPCGPCTGEHGAEIRSEPLLAETFTQPLDHGHGDRRL